MKPCTFLPQPRNCSLKKSYIFPKKTRPEKISHIFLCFRKWNSALFSQNSRNKKLTWRKFLIFQESDTSKKLFTFQETELSYILGRKPCLCFREQNFLIFRKGVFRTVAYLELDRSIFRTITYSEPQHIYNLRHIQNTVNPLR